MARGAPDATLSQIATRLEALGDSGLTLFRSAEGWRANIKRANGGFTCGLARPTLPAAVAQVFGDEAVPATDEWEDLI